MAENSKIEWTHHTFNPWIGCTKVGPGCDRCYAEALATARLGVIWGNEGERRRTAPSTWKQPRRWNNRAAKLGVRERVFCASLADVFDNRADPAVRAELFQLIRETPHLDWLLVTKRIGNAAAMIEAAGGMPENVWLGATIVNQEEANRDIPKLLATPASVRFLSMEPLLGPVDLAPWLAPGLFCADCDDGEGYGNRCSRSDIPSDEQCPWNGAVQVVTEHGPILEGGMPSSITCDVITLDWVIVGGESGPGARPVHPEWVRELRDQCTVSGVSFLFKQWGEWAPREWKRDGGTHAMRCSSPISFQKIRHHPDSCERNEVAPDDWQAFAKAGKAAAGRLLDGVEHTAFPGEVAHG